MKYNHTQVGYPLIFSVLAVLGIYMWIYFWISSIVEFPFIIIHIFMFIILFAVVSFSTLNATIDGKNLKIKFGYGIFKKEFLLKDIKSVKEVRNHWYYGWGIRFWKGMKIYNVSGLKAVEIRMKDNQIYRIGTNEPEELKRAILNSKR